VTDTLTLPDWPANCLTAPRGAVTKVLHGYMDHVPPNGIVVIELPDSVRDRRIVTHRASGVAAGLWGNGRYRVTTEGRLMRVVRL
jgi:hypothetical protein